jgi:PPOX class probable F420-dependent enzyme
VVDRRVESRLKKELIAWLVTAGADRKPQAVPIWFVWDGSSFLIYAQDGAKVRDIEANPQVELHLNSDEVGDGIVRVSGEAKIEARRIRRTSAEYMRKYGSQIKRLGMNPEDYAGTYHNAIRVRKLRWR